MKNLKVTFYGEDGRKLKFDAVFRTKNVLNKFLESYQHYGGINRFEYDLWNDNCKEKLPILTNNDKSFIIVYQNLYQQYA